MTFIESLTAAWAKNNSLLCVGLDPDPAKFPAHLKDRLMFIRVRADQEEWSSYAAKKGINPIIRTYLRQNPQNLHKFTPGSDANPTPRSWEKMSNVLSLNLPEDIRHAAACGTIGEGYATEFEAFMRIGDKLPDPDEVIRNPEEAPLFGPKDADVLRLLLASLADKATTKNVGQIMTYIKRLPNKEFSAVFTHDALSRDKKLQEVPAVRDWLMTDAAKMIFS